MRRRSFFAFLLSLALIPFGVPATVRAATLYVGTEPGDYATGPGQPGTSPPSTICFWKIPDEQCNASRHEGFRSISLRISAWRRRSSREAFTS